MPGPLQGPHHSWGLGDSPGGGRVGGPLGVAFPPRILPTPVAVKGPGPEGRRAGTQRGWSWGRRLFIPTGAHPAVAPTTSPSLETQEGFRPDSAVGWKEGNDRSFPRDRNPEGGGRGHLRGGPAASGPRVPWPTPVAAG